MDKQAHEITKLKEQVENLQMKQRRMLYEAEDQENWSRRNNLRIRGLPEKGGLRKVMKEVFNPLLDRPTEELLKIESVHSIQKPQNVPAETPRDLIVRFQFYEDKVHIWEKMKGIPSLDYEGAKLQLFADLASETLARRKFLKPLLEQLRAKNIKYSWGFAACFIGQKDWSISKT